MTILGSMYSSVAGLGSHGDAMGVVSDNIANVNTVGFKSSRGRFESVLGVTIAEATPNGATGQGSRLASVDQVFQQGALLGTGIATDLAIEGDGFFVTQGNFEGIAGDFYTRAGQFDLDENGFLVNPQGLVVQGYQADATGSILSQIGDLQIPTTMTSPPQVTADVTVATNLDAGAPVLPVFDPTNAGATSNFSTSVTVYDSLGAAHNVDVFFRHTGGGAWEWHALTDGGELTGGTAGVPTETASGTLSFTASGELDTEVTIASDFDFIDAVQDQAIAFDFGDSITTDGGTGTSGSTGYASESTVRTITQDGYASGSLAGFTVDAQGDMVGTFTNGQRLRIARLAIAKFTNNEGLVPGGAGLYAATDESGLPLVGAAGSGGRGAIASGSLEQSNVDLAREFVNMIAYQRGFQANSRGVTTADEMLQELVNLKR